ncbi:MAG: hypothetical protein ACRD09_07045 [Vicinamibacterales bacterium]
MLDDLVFFGWQRLGGALKGEPHAGRLRAKVKLEARAVETGEAQSAEVEFEFYGPRDVLGFLTGAVTGVSPAAGAQSAEETMCAFVELGAPDVPWRYTPVPRDAVHADAWQPWIVLVVGPTNQVALQPGGRVSIAHDVLMKHPLAQSARWAHVQQTNPPAPAQSHLVSRLLSPYDMAPNTDYLAVVVPAFTANGTPAWSGGDAEVELPVYYSWRFRTGDAGDFKDLALRLRARNIDDAQVAQVGRGDLEYPLPVAANVVTVRSALVPPSAVPPSGVDPDGPAPADVTAANVAMRLPATDAQGRHIVQLPRYGETWVADPLQPPAGWGAILNGEPRHRIAAGLGLWCGVAKQDLITDAARERAAGLFVAAQRMRALTAGLAAGGSLWTRHLPASPENRLALFGPALARVAATDAAGGGATVLSAITDRDNGRSNGRPMPPALLSSAARRMLRPGTARARQAKPGALAPAAIIAAANSCSRLVPVRRPAEAPDGGKSQRGLPHADFLGSDLGLGDSRNVFGAPDDAALARSLTDAGADPDFLGVVPRARWAELLRAVVSPSGRRPTDATLAALRDRAVDDPQDTGLGRLQEALGREPPPRARCRPVDLARLDKALQDAFRPDRNGVAARRVLDTIAGLDPAEPFAPPEICPDLDLPAWRFLRDEGRKWLLLGREGIQPDDVIALGTNPRFVNAFLAGLNTQALGEMRWRNIPVRSRCTPLRRFWERVTPATAALPSAPTTDIVGIHKWTVNQPLGHPDHAPDPDQTRQLVLVFRTELFRRYPRTLVYLTPATKNAAGKPDWMKDATFAQNTAPVFTGEIDEDLVFFGFPVKPEALSDLWVVVEEAPPGYRFGVAKLAASAKPDGGGAAHDAFALPTRVLFRGDQFLGSPL